MRFRLFPLIALALVGTTFAATKQRLQEKYSNWLNRDAAYIITDEEKKAFLGLETDAQRDKYIADFWEIRNPARGSGHNPFKEEHYRRIEYANEHFGRQTNTPGWMTDMGRTYILFGKPASRVPFTGYGQIYPLELWFYSNSTGAPSLPPFFYLLFFMPADVGEYRYYHPFIDGPLKLVRGSQFNSNRDVYNFLKPLGGDLARAAFTLSPGEPLDTQDFQPSMTAEMLVNKIQDFANDPFNVRRIRTARELRAQVSSWLLVGEDKPLAVSDVVLRDFAGFDWLDYAVLIDDPTLGRAKPEAGELTVDCRVRLLSESGETIIEDQEERAYNAFEKTGSGTVFQPFLLASRLPVTPGTFNLQVEVVNRETGKLYRAERKFAVESPGKVSVGKLLLAGSAERVARPDGTTPFQFFGTQFAPIQAGQSNKGDPLLALFQLQAPPGSAQAYRIDYLVANPQTPEARRTLHDIIPFSEFREGTLLKVKTLPIQDLEAGSYRLVVSVRAAGSEQVLASSTTTFRIVAASDQARLFFLSHSRPASSPALASYLRALEWLSRKEDDQAAQSLLSALQANPTNGLAARVLVQLYFRKLRYADVSSLYGRLGLEPFKSVPESMAQVVLSLWHTGDSQGASHVLTTAEASFPKNELLAAVRRQTRLATGEPAARAQ